MIDVHRPRTQSKEGKGGVPQAFAGDGGARKKTKSWFTELYPLQLFSFLFGSGGGVLWGREG